MKKLEEEYEQICSAASLFEVHVPDPKSLKQCRRELKFVKQLWDYIFIVESMFSDWKKTPWKKINVENMDIECKRMAKEVKGMDKDVKHWKIYINLESTVRNMISSLKSVSELQNPSIRERHWQELMVTTKVHSLRRLSVSIDTFSYMCYTNLFNVAFRSSPDCINT